MIVIVAFIVFCVVMFAAIRKFEVSDSTTEIRSVDEERKKGYEEVFHTIRQHRQITQD
jgi:hypothetical protein